MGKHITENIFYCKMYRTKRSIVGVNVPENRGGESGKAKETFDYDNDWYNHFNYYYPVGLFRI